MKKTLAVVLSAVMVSGLALSGCGGNSTSATTAAPKETTTAEPAETKKEETKGEEAKGEAPAGEQVTITMSNWLEAEEATSDIFKELLNDFMAANPDIKVESQAIPFNQYKDQVLIAGTSGNAADVIMGNSQMMSAFNGAGILAELDDLASGDVLDDIYPGYLSGTTYGGKVKALSWAPHPIAMYYNKDLFTKAGLDPEQPPKTWQDLADYAAKLKASGMKCGYASGWQGWIQLENFSAWNGLPFASKNNGFDGTDAVLEFNKPEQVKHIAMLEEMNKKGDFSYVGRKDESTEKFYNGDCAMTTASSGSLANIREYAKFNYGVGMMPYDADAKDAPQNAIIGGASLWVMQGKDKETYTGVAKFLDFLAKPENAAEWHQKTGYLPITKAAYDLTREQGFYEKNPGADTATRQMLNKPPLPFTKGLRLGNMPQIRVIVDEELESVWTGKKTPQQALDTAVERGNQLLRRFEQSTKS